MRLRSLFWCGVAFLTATADGQDGYQWQDLSGAPYAARHNDAFFVNPDTGWIVNGWGEVHRTTNGGGSWDRQLYLVNSHFRSVGFLDSKRGWIGNVGYGEFGATDSTLLYRTEDGGATWVPQDSVEAPSGTGICGMFVVNDSVIYAVGRVRGPALFVKTTDGGMSWTSTDMSTHAAGLIDLHFFGPDTGYAVGLTNKNHDESSGIVLYTEDGGETWEPQIITSRKGEWCWKIDFPSREVAYVSLQRNSESPIYFLKTRDRGEIWEEVLFSESYYFVQGIGFLNESVGWIGGNSAYPCYITLDGGDSWQPDRFGSRVNRFRFIGNVGYAVGRSVYKLTLPPVESPKEITLPLMTNLEQNYPNPFNTTTVLRYQLSRESHVRLTIYSASGQQILRAVDRSQSRGNYSITWNGKNGEGLAVAPGVYLYRLETGAFAATRKMILLK